MAFSSWRTWTTGEVVTAAHMNQEVRDNGEALFPDEEAAVDWSPSLSGESSNPGITGKQGRRWRVGPLQFVWVRFEFDNGGSGVYSVELPVAASGVTANSAAHSGQAVGGWSARDVSVPGNNASGVVNLQTSTTVIFSLSDNGVVGDTTPFEFDDGDFLSFHAVYPVA